MDTVTVACKIPNGLIVHTHDKSGKKRTFTLNGNRLPIHPKTGREVHRFETAGDTTHGTGGYGLTPGVPKDLWAQIVKESAETPPFANGLVWALGDLASARDQAKDMAPHVENGMDPIDPDKPLAAKVEKLERDE